MNQSFLSIVIGVAVFTAAILLVQAAVAGYGAYRRRFTDHARTRLKEAFVFVDPNKLFLLTVLGTVVVPPVLWVLTGNLVLPIGMAVLALALPRVAFVVINRKRRLRICLLYTSPSPRD